MKILLTTCLLACASGGCVTTEHVSFFSAGELDVVQTAPVRSWMAVVGDEPAGYVVHLRAADSPERQYFSVRNCQNQELGMVDALGRAWRYRPHQGEAEWLGTGTVSEGVALILDAAGLRLVDVAADAPDLAAIATS